MRPLAIAFFVLHVPSLALAAANVRADRPRLLLSNGTGFGTSLLTFKTRCTSDPRYQTRCQGSVASNGGSYPAITAAADYLVNGTASRCTDAYTRLQTVADDTPGQPDAHSFISNNGRTMAQLAVVRDWCDPVLTAPQKTWIEGRIVAYADWYVANGAPDVFHDDMPNVWNAVALAGLALKGTAQDAKAAGYLSAADTQWKTVVLPAMAYVGDWWHEGFTYVQPSLGSLAWYATAWSTATDEDLFAYAQTQAGDLFNGYLAFHAYAMRPDYRYFYFGDSSDNKQSVELFSRPLVDMLTAGTGSPLGQAVSLDIKAGSRPGYDYSGADAFLMALFYDASKDATATARASLPTARWLSRGANDVAILRSGWSANDTAIMLTCGDYLGAHQHDEAGSFQIFRKSALTGSSGYYDNFDSPHWANYYSQHSVHANTLAIYQPGEVFPTSLSIGNPANNVNDGGQRPLRRNKNGTGYPSPNLATYLTNKQAGTFYETGDLKTFVQSACHSYVACDVTAAYSSPGYVLNGNTAKVTEVTRQFVFFPPARLVVFDRVQATDVSYPKRFLLHAMGTASLQGGGAFTLTNGAGVLSGKTLLPAGASAAIVSNFTVAGTSYAPNPAGLESGGSRIEVSAPTTAARDYFLHVLDAVDAASAPPATLQEDAASATVTIADPGATYTLTFNKTGAMGGQVKVVRGTEVVCDQDLGAAGPSLDGGTAPDAGGEVDAGVASDGGVAADGGPASDSGTGANPPGASGGCGCTAVSADSGWVGLWVLAGSARARRRRAR